MPDETSEKAGAATLPAAWELAGPDPVRIHMMGVGGAGMSAIAVLLTQLGHRVNGCDREDSPLLAQLTEQGVAVQVGHDPAHLREADLLAVSSAVHPNVPEVAAANAAGVPVVRRPELMAAIGGLRPVVAVAGTHGKTTTSAMLAHILTETGADPSYVVGAELIGHGPGGRWGGGQWLVAEADESDGTFLDLQARHAVLTSVEPDHLVHHGSAEGLEANFAHFCAMAEELLVVCADDPVAVRLAAPYRPVTYGFAAGADYQLRDDTGGRHDFAVVVDGPDGLQTSLPCPLPGRHNARNAGGALAAAHHLGVDFAAAAAALGGFRGVARRFESRGIVSGVTFVDDYAHLPGEIAGTLEAVRERGWNRVVCAFQPHRFTRTAQLWESFADCFGGADVLLLSDIYSAGEPPIAGVSGELIWKAVTSAHPEANVEYLPSLAEVADRLAELLQPGDLCLTLAAGDLTTVPDQVQQLLRERA